MPFSGHFSGFYPHYLAVWRRQEWIGERRSLLQIPTLIRLWILGTSADSMLCIGHLNIYQLLNRLVQGGQGGSRVSAKELIPFATIAFL